MSGKVNVGARIKRHSRILKDNILNNNKNSKNKSNTGYTIIVLVMVFLFPVYPILSSKVYGNTQTTFDRRDIDESSIIGSYSGGDSGVDEKSPILESTDSFLSVSTLLTGDRDLSGTNEIIDYEVKSGESVSSIAYKFKVANQSIYDNNNFSKNHIIHPGDFIKIPPVSGLIHQIKSGETISSIAKKYKIDSNKIVEQNLLAVEDSLVKGNVLVIPGAIKEVPRPVYKKPKKYVTKRKSGYSFANITGSQYANTKGVYNLTVKPSYHTFYWGNCTWYVAKYKTVKWGGNAKDWLRNAKSKGYSTGSNPSVGSIVVFYGKGYNPRYGHVGIVMDVKGGNIIVSDMNYRKLGELTYRKVPINNRAIKGYIYVD